MASTDPTASPSGLVCAQRTMVRAPSTRAAIEAKSLRWASPMATGQAMAKPQPLSSPGSPAPSGATG